MDYLPWQETTSYQILNFAGRQTKKEVMFVVIRINSFIVSLYTSFPSNINLLFFISFLRTFSFFLLFLFFLLSMVLLTYKILEC